MSTINVALLKSPNSATVTFVRTHRGAALFHGFGSAQALLVNPRCRLSMWAMIEREDDPRDGLTHFCFFLGALLRHGLVGLFLLTDLRRVATRDGGNGDGGGEGDQHGDKWLFMLNLL